nr:copper resistance CopC family protein [Isoptericola halotolerans]
MVLGVAPPASAHNYVVSTDPAEDEDATTAVEEVSVTFNDVVLDLGRDATTVDVTGPDGRHHAVACPELSDETVSVPVELGGPGEYRVAWRIVSADGHPVSGDFTFTYTPPSGTDEAAGAAGPVCAPAGAGTGEAEDAQGDQSTSGSTPPAGVLIAVAGGTVLLGVAVVLALVVAGRQHRRRQDGASD